MKKIWLVGFIVMILLVAGTSAVTDKEKEELAKKVIEYRESIKKDLLRAQALVQREPLSAKKETMLAEIQRRLDRINNLPPIVIQGEKVDVKTEFEAINQFAIEEVDKTDMPAKPEAEFDGSVLANHLPVYFYGKYKAFMQVNMQPYRISYLSDDARGKEAGDLLLGSIPGNVIALPGDGKPVEFKAEFTRHSPWGADFEEDDVDMWHYWTVEPDVLNMDIRETDGEISSADSGLGEAEAILKKFPQGSAANLTAPQIPLGGEEQEYTVTFTAKFRRGFLIANDDVIQIQWRVKFMPADVYNNTKFDELFPKAQAYLQRNDLKEALDMNDRLESLVPADKVQVFQHFRLALAKAYVDEGHRRLNRNPGEHATIRTEIFDKVSSKRLCAFGGIRDGKEACEDGIDSLDTRLTHSSQNQVSVLVIVRGADKNPLQGAVVQIDGANATCKVTSNAKTSTEGECRIVNKQPGDHTITVTHTGYAEAKSVIKDMKRADFRVVEIDMVKVGLTKGTIEGTVYVDGVQASHALNIKVDPPKANGNNVGVTFDGKSDVFVTSADGKFKISLIDKDEEVTLSPNDKRKYHNASTTIEAEEGVTKLVLLEFITKEAYEAMTKGTLLGRATVDGNEATEQITLNITNATGHVVKVDGDGVNVKVGGGKEAFKTTRRGEYKITGLLPGDYNINADGAKYHGTLSFPVIVVGGVNEFKFDLTTRQEASKEGVGAVEFEIINKSTGKHVVIPTGNINPAAAAADKAINSVPQMVDAIGDAAKAEMDPTNRIHKLPKVKAGQYIIELVYSGYIIDNPERTITVEAGKTARERFEIQPVINKGIVVVYVQDKDGNPLGKDEAEVNGYGITAHGEKVVKDLAVPGTHQIKVTSEGYFEETRSVELTVEKPAAEIRVQLQPISENIEAIKDKAKEVDIAMAELEVKKRRLFELLKETDDDEYIDMIKRITAAGEEANKTLTEINDATLTAANIEKYLKLLDNLHRDLLKLNSRADRLLRES